MSTAPAAGDGRVLLAVTGSIAAYKACEVLRRLRDRGLEVRVALSPAGSEFVSATTFAALSGHRVIDGTFTDPEPEDVAHVAWGEWCDVFCVVPASADFLAKMALGIADDFPSTVHLACRGDVVVAPAMEDRMWRHPAVQANVETLRERGVTVVGPERGPLASGREGPGRLADPEVVVAAVVDHLASRAGPLAGMSVLVTAGPTREHLDPVRVLTNPSSGKMGFAVADVARRRGAAVTVLVGATQLEPPHDVRVRRAVSGDEMRRAVLEEAPAADVVVMAAAVSDFRAREPLSEKLKKHEEERLRLDLVRTPDILESLSDVPGSRVLVGFAAETSEVESRAAEKLARKGCDLMVGNRVGGETGGFESDDNEVVILDRLGGRRAAGPASKDEIASALWDAVSDFLERVSDETPEEAGEEARETSRKAG